MSAQAAAQCKNCRKPFAGKRPNIIGFQLTGQPETKYPFCTPCAERIARNSVRLEREHSRKGVLIA